MLRVALFVEGHTELCLVREMLLKHHQYSNVSISCTELHSSESHEVPYCYNSGGSFEFDYRIICTNGDAVITRVAERSQYLEHGNFDLVIGIRDIYSQEYDDLAYGRIEETLIREMVYRQRKSFDKLVVCSAEKHLCFARMEVEAWILSMPGLLTRVTGAVNDSEHLELYKPNDHRVNVEKEVYRPAVLLNTVYSRFGKTYDKSREESNRIAHLLDITDVTFLLETKSALHFNELWAALRL